MKVSQQALKTVCIKLVLLVSMLGAAVSFANPIAYTPQDTHDFGDLNMKTSAKHVFIIRNNGSSKLVIEKIEAG